MNPTHKEENYSSEEENSDPIDDVPFYSSMSSVLESDPVHFRLKNLATKTSYREQQLKADIKETEELLISLHKQLRKTMKYGKKIKCDVIDRKRKISHSWEDLSKRYNFSLHDNHFSLMSAILMDELYLCIFTFLDYTTLSRLSLVCKKWNRLSCDNYLWLNITANFFTSKNISLKQRISTTPQQPQQQYQLPVLYKLWKNYFADRYVSQKQFTTVHHMELIAARKLYEGDLNTFDMLFVMSIEKCRDERDTSILTINTHNCYSYENWGDALSFKAKTADRITADLILQQAAKKYVKAIASHVKINYKDEPEGNLENLNCTNKRSVKRALHIREFKRKYYSEFSKNVDPDADLENLASFEFCFNDSEDSGEDFHINSHEIPTVFSLGSSISASVPSSPTLSPPIIRRLRQVSSEELLPSNTENPRSFNTSSGINLRHIRNSTRDKKRPRYRSPSSGNIPDGNIMIRRVDYDRVSSPDDLSPVGSESSIYDPKNNKNSEGKSDHDVRIPGEGFVFLPIQESEGTNSKDGKIKVNSIESANTEKNCGENILEGKSVKKVSPRDSKASKPNKITNSEKKLPDKNSLQEKIKEFPANSVSNGKIQSSTKGSSGPSKKSRTKVARAKSSSSTTKQITKEKDNGTKHSESKRDVSRTKVIARAKSSSASTDYDQGYHDDEDEDLGPKTRSLVKLDGTIVVYKIQTQTQTQIPTLVQTKHQQQITTPTSGNNGNMSMALAHLNMVKHMVLLYKYAITLVKRVKILTTKHVEEEEEKPNKNNESDDEEAIEHKHVSSDNGNTENEQDITNLLLQANVLCAKILHVVDALVRDYKRPKSQTTIQSRSHRRFKSQDSKVISKTQRSSPTIRISRNLSDSDSESTHFKIDKILSECQEQENDISLESRKKSRDVQSFPGKTSTFSSIDFWMEVYCPCCGLRYREKFSHEVLILQATIYKIRARTAISKGENCKKKIESYLNKCAYNYNKILEVEPQHHYVILQMARLFALRGLENRCYYYLDRYMKVASNRLVHLDFEDFDKYRERDWFKSLSKNSKEEEVATNVSYPIPIPTNTDVNNNDDIHKRRFVRVRKKSQKQTEQVTDIDKLIKTCVQKEH